MDFNETGVVKAICISPGPGTEKHTIRKAILFRISELRAMPTRERGTGR